MHVTRRATSHCTLINSIGDKTASLKKLSYVPAARQTMLNCEVRDDFPGLKDQAFAVSDHPLHVRFYHRLKRGLEVANRAYLETSGLDAKLDPSVYCLL